MVFNTHYLHNLHRAIASSIYNAGKTRKILLCIFDFKIAAELVYEYLFTLVKAKDDQSVLKSCQANNIFSARVSFIIYINYHGTAW